MQHTAVKSLQARVWSFWFDGFVDSAPLPPACFQRWFGGRPETDEFIRTHFHSTINAILLAPPATTQSTNQPNPVHSNLTNPIQTHSTQPHSNQLNQSLADERTAILHELQATPQGKLALILLLDQFTRNIYRGTKEAFAGDPTSLHLALSMIQTGHDRLLHPIPRSFIYLPLEHAEDRAMQRLCVEKFTGMLEEEEGEAGVYLGVLKSCLEYAKKHQVIVDRFGRFPHRNKVLGRQSTPEEEEFLKNGGDTFEAAK
jgi:uncharacterized protein (DUF924 family)